MKKINCPICETDLEYFIRNLYSLHCNCKSNNCNIICPGIYIALKKFNSRASFIQLFYKSLTFYFEDKIFSLSTNGIEITKGNHYINFTENSLENIYNQLEFCFKYEESLMFL